MKVATSKVISKGIFIAESPANVGRGLETCREMKEAKRDFADQTDVDNYVTARGGVTAQWVVLDLGAAGVT